MTRAHDGVRCHAAPGEFEWAIGWLRVASVYGLDLPAIGRLHAQTPDPGTALRRLRSGGDDLRGIVRPSVRSRVASSAVRCASSSSVAAALTASGARVARSDQVLGGRLDDGALWPPVVSVLGRHEARPSGPTGPTVAIVGMRRCSLAGAAFAGDLAGRLAGRGVTVVSGLAFGIDVAAHRGAVEAGGTTVAVLAGGVTNISPRRHAALAAEIASGRGCLVSHVPPEADSPGWRFPVRNRMIAGLADAVVVVEAAARGGALSTARHALDLGRPLLAVPGFPWSVHAAGTNALLADGAMVCCGVDDVVTALGLSGAAACDPGVAVAADADADVAESSPDDPDSDGPDGEILGLVDYVPTPIEILVTRSGWSTLEVLGALGRLQLAGRVAFPAPATVIRAPREGGRAG